MAEIYRLYTEADYEATTKVTGVTQSQEWDETAHLAGISGDIKFTTAGSGSVYCWAPHNVPSNNYYQYSGYVNRASYEITQDNALALLHYGTSSGGTFRTGIYMRRSSGVNVLSHRIQQDSGNVQAVDLTLPSETFQYNVIVKKSTNSSTADAYQEVYINGVLASIISNITVFNVFDFARVQIGPYSVSSSNTGSIYIGKIRVTDTANPIGPIVSYRHRPRPAAIMKKRQRIKGYRCG